MILFYLIFNFIFTLSYSKLTCDRIQQLDPLEFENHFYNSYTIDEIEKSCGYKSFCLNHNSTVWLHNIMNKMSLKWLNLRLNYQVCSEESIKCIDKLLDNSTNIQYKNLTLASFNLMCQTSLETDNNEQCIMGGLELIQYAYVHYKNNLSSTFTNQTGNCNTKIPLTQNDSLCTQIKNQYQCQSHYCSADGYQRFVNAIYPNMASILNDQYDNNSVYCKILQIQNKPSDEKIIVQFIKKVNIKSAVIGIVLLLILSLIALVVTCYYTGKFSVLNAGRRYIPLINKPMKHDYSTTTASTTSLHKDDLKEEEKARLLPDDAT